MLNLDKNNFIFIINNFLLNETINSKLLLKIIDIYKNNNISLKYLLNHCNFNLDYVFFELEDFNYYYQIINNHYNNNFIKYLDIKHLNDYNCFYNMPQNNIINFNFYSNLKTLNLIENRELRDNHIKYLTNLNELVLPKNKLITDKGIINLNKLKYIDLSHNKNITNLSIKNKLKLEKIVLLYNQNINDYGFVNINNLKSINLGYNKNKHLNLEFIKNNKNLEELCIFEKKLNEDIKEYAIKNIKFLIIS